MGFLRTGLRILNRATITATMAASLLSCSHLKLEKPLDAKEAFWPTYGKDRERKGHSDEPLTPPLTLAWSNDVTSAMGHGSPLVIDSMVIAGTLRGELHIIDAITGKRRGWIDLVDAINGSPVVDGSIVYLAGSNTDESLVAFDMVQGKTVWRKGYGDIEISPLLSGKQIYVGNTMGEFFCVSGSDGETLWKFQIPDNKSRKGIRSSPALADGRVVFGADDGAVYALDEQTGKLVWRFDTDHAIVAPVTVADGSVLFGNLAGLFVSVDAATGTLQWSVSLGKSIYAGAAIAGELALIGTTDGFFFGVVRSNGSIRWRTELGSVVNASAVVAGRYAYVGLLNKSLFGIRTADGEVVYKTTVQGRIKTAPAVAYGRLYVASDDRLILAFTGAEQ
jgi:outer membrane protein assembly factor BamB